MEKLTIAGSVPKHEFSPAQSLSHQLSHTVKNGGTAAGAGFPEKEQALLERIEQNKKSIEKFLTLLETVDF